MSSPWTAESDRERTPDASVIVVNWLRPDLTQEALRSLELQQTTFSFEVILVENEAHGPTALSDEFPHVRIVINNENLGFAGGVNSGIHISRGPIIVLLNNDAIADPRFLQAGISRLRESDPKVAAVAPLIVLRDSSAVEDRAGRERVLVNGTGICLDRSGNGYDRDWLVPLSELRRAADSQPFGFSGGGAFLRREALDAVGMFDEAFFMYYEDLDLSWRMRLSGRVTVYEPAAIVRHLHAASAGRDSELLRFQSMRNRLLSVAKNGSIRFMLRVLARTLARMILDLGLSLLRRSSRMQLSLPAWARLWSTIFALGPHALASRQSSREIAKSRRRLEAQFRRPPAPEGSGVPGRLHRRVKS